MSRRTSRHRNSSQIVFDFDDLDTSDEQEPECDDEQDCMNLVYQHPSGGALWQGGNTACLDCPNLDELGIKVVVFAAMEYQPRMPSRFDVVRAKLDDDFRMPHRIAVEVAKCADEVSDLLVNRIINGQGVLSSCWMGWNRSGLMSAITVAKLAGCDPDRAIRLVKNARGPSALSNPVFVAIVRGLIQARCQPKR